MKKEGKIGIHTGNILPIIKKWLYSEHDIFLRELISNAQDAITKLKYLENLGEYSSPPKEYRIDLLTDKKNKTLTIKDNGIGLTAEEVEQYIAQVAFSGAKDFVSKYESAESSKDIIGFFGLGFYSAFMVAKAVEILSLSYKENAQAIYWKSQGDESYEMDSSEKKDVGTEIVLHLEEGSQKFLEDDTLKTTIAKYSSFLPTPIYLNGELLPSHAAVWRRSPSEIQEEDYTTLYKALFPNRITNPILHFHIKTEFPFEVNGIFYFPRSNKGMEPQEGNVKLFVKDVFVGEGLKEIVPEFLSPLLGVIESNDIPLNVSRSQLQGDPRIHKLATHIENKFTERLIQIFKDEREKMLEIWPDISPFMKFGVMRSDHFYDRIKDYLLLQTSENQWITLKEFLEQPNLPKKEGKTILFYVDKIVGFSSYTESLKNKNIPYLVMESPFDGHFYSFLEQKNTDIQFARVDSEINETLTDSQTEIQDSQKEALSQLFQGLLKEEKLLFEVKALDNPKIPAVAVSNEQMRRWQEMSAMMGQAPSLDLSLGKTLILNTKNALVRKVELLKQEDRIQEATDLAQEIVDLALLETGALSQEKQRAFIARTIQILEE